MATQINIIVGICVSLLVLATTVTSHRPEPSDPADGAFGGGAIDIVADCGAKENTDITKQLEKAWADACACTNPSKIVIPPGVYDLGEIDFMGPCKAPIQFQLDGTVKAPVDPSHFNDPSWVTFKKVEFLTIFGSGAFDGQGHIAWEKNDCHKTIKCKQLPISVRLDFLNHTIIKGITSQDSKNFNINLLECNNVTFEGVKIVTAPGSVNTDGIHMGRSRCITITDSKLECGDDCISIGDGTENVTISKVKCGPGHGISIGSLGRYTKEAPVIGVHISDCTLSQTTNGVRIKSWPGEHVNSVDDIVFEGITMDNVSNPIILDQGYCPWNQCKKGASTSVKMSNVVFRNIKGTSACPDAVKLLCSPGKCENVELADIDIKYDGPQQDKFESVCTNVKPKITGSLNPPGPSCC